MGTTGTKQNETCQKDILVGTTGTKTGRTFQIQGEIVLIGTKTKKLFPKRKLVNMIEKINGKRLYL